MAIGVIVSPSPCHRWQLARRAAFLLGSPAALTQRAAANGMGSITQDTSAWPMAVARSCGYMWYQDVPRTIHPSAFSALRFGGPHSHIHIHIIIIIILILILIIIIIPLLLYLLLPLLLLLILFNPPYTEIGGTNCMICRMERSTATDHRLRRLAA
jgi:hypothetical protein